MNYEVPHCGALSIPHSHHFWAQILVSGSCLKIPLARITPFNVREHVYQTCSIIG